MTGSEITMSDASVADYLASVDHKGRREDAVILDKLFQRVTGWKPRLWGGSMVGYGFYDYTYKSGRSGRWFSTGFAPRKANMALHIMPGYADFGDLLERLGPHKTGAACIYFGRLSKVDQDVLRQVINAGLENLRTQWPVSPT